jgi:hypothetical protein
MIASTAAVSVATGKSWVLQHNFRGDIRHNPLHGSIEHGSGGGVGRLMLTGV